MRCEGDAAMWWTYLGIFFWGQTELRHDEVWSPGPKNPKSSATKPTIFSETFRWPQPPVFFQKYCRTNGGRTAVQMGGVLQYKWEAYCRVSLSSKHRSQESAAIQMGSVLPYKLEVYCRTFFETSRGWGFRNIAHLNFNFSGFPRGSSEAIFRI